MAEEAQIRPDADMDGIVDATEVLRDRAEVYAEQLATFGDVAAAA